MRIGQVKKLLLEAIKSRRVICLSGPPGCGKTDIVIEACDEADAELMIMHPVVQDPTDAKGLPDFDREAGIARWYPFAYLAKMMHYALGKTLVVFLDDFGQAPVAVQAAWMQLLLQREVNGFKISPSVTFIIATNRKQDRAGVAGILEPVKSRFTTIVEVEPYLPDFIEWWHKNNLRPEVPAFLQFREGLLCDFKPTADLSNSPMPRTWYHIHQLLEFNFGDDMRDVELETFKGAIGEGAATEFFAFIRKFRKAIDLNKILLNPQVAPIPTETDMLYAVAVGLGAKANKTNLGKVIEYAHRLCDEKLAEFGVIAISTALKRDPSLLSHPEGRKLAFGNSPLTQLFLST